MVNTSVTPQVVPDSTGHGSKGDVEQCANTDQQEVIKSNSRVDVDAEGMNGNEQPDELPTLEECQQQHWWVTSSEAGMTSR